MRLWLSRRALLARLAELEERVERLELVDGWDPPPNPLPEVERIDVHAHWRGIADRAAAAGPWDEMWDEIRRGYL